MKNFLTKIILLLFCISMACSKVEKLNVSEITNTHEENKLSVTQDEKTNIPKTWKKFEDCGLSFYAPASFEEVKFQPIDSCAKEYRNNDIFMLLDVIQSVGVKESDTTKNEYIDERDFEITETKIDNRKAEIITFFGKNDFPDRKDLSYSAVLFVPVIGENRDNLTIWTYSRSAEDRETAKKIFRTIKFE